MSEATEARKVVHLLWGERTLCGLTRAEAEATYEATSPACETCGPRDRPNYYGAALAAEERGHYNEAAKWYERADEAAPLDNPDQRCADCGQTVRYVQGEWVDDIGTGCTGRGEWGEVLPHRPHMIEGPRGTFRPATYAE